MSMRIYCDFDGTIATIDTTDRVLDQLADPAWEHLEKRWVAGEITAAQCMREQIALIGGDDDALNAVLDRIEIRSGFIELVAWCRQAGVALTVVSDGVDRFIHRILSRYGLGDLPIVANRLAGDAIAGRRLEQPWTRAGCAAGSGVCKCQVVAADGDGPVVFIGDGRSDFCVSGRVDLLFARDALAAYAQSRAMAYHPFSDFHTITTTLAAAHDRVAQRAAV
jgi:2-hydroxy-3-keto-5-methylthiopentenyl-1-phosphate phosphatase